MWRKKTCCWFKSLWIAALTSQGTWSRSNVHRHIFRKRSLSLLQWQRLTIFMSSLSWALPWVPHCTSLSRILAIINSLAILVVSLQLLKCNARAVACAMSKTCSARQSTVNARVRERSKKWKIALFFLLEETSQMNYKFSRWIDCQWQSTFYSCLAEIIANDFISNTRNQNIKEIDGGELNWIATVLSLDDLWIAF
jgi:hypothetical protein